MVADQHDTAVVPGKRGHAIVGIRHPQSVIHEVAGLRDHRVPVPVGQIQQLCGVRLERPNPGVGGTR